ncbi:hypothetical protein J6590_033245 [Homalodisca vitripennis]|nr:hypothetical protein J6590_033245 [Homalodisca vitripennis]
MGSASSSQARGCYVQGTNHHTDEVLIQLMGSASSPKARGCYVQGTNQHTDEEVSYFDPLFQAGTYSAHGLCFVITSEGVLCPGVLISTRMRSCILFSTPFFKEVLIQRIDYDFVVSRGRVPRPGMLIQAHRHSLCSLMLSRSPGVSEGLMDICKCREQRLLLVSGLTSVAFLGNPHHRTRAVTVLRVQSPASH